MRWLICGSDRESEIEGLIDKLVLAIFSVIMCFMCFVFVIWSLENTERTKHTNNYMCFYIYACLISTRDVYCQFLKFIRNRKLHTQALSCCYTQDFISQCVQCAQLWLSYHTLAITWSTVHRLLFAFILQWHAFIYEDPMKRESPPQWGT